MWFADAMVDELAPVRGMESASDRRPAGREVFEELYRSTAKPLRNYLARVSGDSALADDLLQESFYRFRRTPPGAARETLWKPYLWRIATNLLTDHGRRKSRERRWAIRSQFEEATLPTYSLAALAATVALISFAVAMDSARNLSSR